MMEVMRLSYEKSINLLKAKGVEFEAGLTDVEMGKFRCMNIPGIGLTVFRKEVNNRGR